MFRRCLRPLFLRLHASLLAPQVTHSPETPIVGGKHMSESLCVLTDLVGSPHNDLPVRLQAGELLGRLDICGARAALKHITGEFSAPGSNRQLSVATVAMDDIHFCSPLVNGDMLRLEGIATIAGRTSIAVHVKISRIQFPTRAVKPIANALVYMVAINSSLEPVAVVPPLIVENNEHKRLHQLSIDARRRREERQNLFKGIMRDPVLPSQIEDPVNRSKKYLVPFADTQVVLNRVFFAKHLNFNNTIFGGEILRWMEHNATHCGRLFAGSRNVFSVEMYSVEFNYPIRASDWVTLEAAVVYVRHSSMVVEVRVFAERESLQKETTCASFVLVNMDEAGQKKEIPCGLDLSRASQDWLQRYACAKIRYESSMSPHQHQCSTESE